jgi:hypothetical protein
MKKALIPVYSNRGPGLLKSGATLRSRTGDPLITNEMLYQLS